MQRTSLTLLLHSSSRASSCTRKLNDDDDTTRRALLFEIAAHTDDDSQLTSTRARLRRGVSITRRLTHFRSRTETALRSANNLRGRASSAATRASERAISLTSTNFVFAPSVPHNWRKASHRRPSRARSDALTAATDPVLFFWPPRQAAARYRLATCRPVPSS